VCLYLRSSNLVETLVFQMLVKFDNVVEHQGTDLARAIHHTHECLGSHSKEHSLSRPRVFRCTSIVNISLSFFFLYLSFFLR